MSYSSWYVQGEWLSGGNSNGEFHFRSSAQLIAIVANTPYIPGDAREFGFYGVGTNGWETDTTWKCQGSPQHYTDWSEDTNFDDSGWYYAYPSPVAMDPPGIGGTLYAACRKDF